LQEVNFWQPSGGREFHVLAPGEPFFFKTHYPHNSIASTTGCCSGQTSTPSSTADTSASTPATAF